MKRLVQVALLAVAGACGGDDEPTGPDQNGPTVSASAANVFSPATIEVAIGQSVTWVFGPVDHNVIFNPVTGAPQDIPIVRNTSVARTFSSAGTFPYVCTLHAGMNGTVRVLAEPSGSSLY